MLVTWWRYEVGKDVILAEFNRLLGKLARELWLVKDVLQWIGGEHHNGMAIEVWEKLACCND